MCHLKVGVCVLIVPVGDDNVAGPGIVGSTGGGTVKTRPVLHEPAPLESDVRIHHVAVPVASSTSGIPPQIPVPVGHEAADAVYVVLMRACWLASFTQS